MIEDLGGESGILEKCLDKKYQTGNPVPENSLETAFKNLNNNIKKPLEILGKVIDALCLVRMIVKGFITGSNFAKKFKSSKAFIQGESKALATTENIFDDIWDEIKDAVSDLKKKASSLNKKFDSFKGDVDDFIDDAGKTLSAPLNQIVDFAKAFSNGIREILKGKMFQEFKKFADCALKVGIWGTGIARVVIGVYSKITAISAGLAAGGAGVFLPLADIMVGLVCKWKDFVKAIGYLIQGINSSKTVQRWMYFGRFFGRMLFAFATA